METTVKRTKERAYDRFNDVLVRDYGKTLVEVCEALGFKQEYIDFIKVDESDIEACKANARKYKATIMDMDGVYKDNYLRLGWRESFCDVP